jgi:hypothetical protein
MKSEKNYMILLNRSKWTKSLSKSYYLFIFDRVKYMEDWLMQKKMNEAHKIAQLMDYQEKESIEKQMRDQHNFKSYRDWLKKNMLKEKQ